MLVISHRGYARSLMSGTRANQHTITQNTIEAFQQAVGLGVDGIETDVRITADGQAVLFHDRNLPDGRAVASIDHTELERAVGHGVPLLEDVLERWDVLWNLELKVKEAVEPVIAAVHRFANDRRFLVTSFRHDCVESCAKQLDVDLGLLVCHRPIDLQAAILGRWQRHRQVRTVVWDYSFVDPQLIQQATAAGWRNIVFTTQNAREHQQCRDWAVDAVITDHLPQLTKSP